MKELSHLIPEGTRKRAEQLGSVLRDKKEDFSVWDCRITRKKIIVDFISKG